jgi:L-methionine (R)-S-oxide reductase
MDAHASAVASEDWEEVTARILALIEGEDDDIAKMATMACELYQAFERFHWVGFYRAVAPQLLKIGPYQGGHGCLTIPFSRGVCGACATAGKTIIVPDVDAFPGHIACSSTTRSELVAPVFSGGRLIAVLDLDSDHPDAFSEADRIAVENLLSRAFGQ